MVPDVHQTMVGNASADQIGGTDSEAEQRHTTGRRYKFLLANLFLHYAMDKWLEQTHPTVSYVRYADDAILHCRDKAQAEEVLKTLKVRMLKCGLELHPEKTKLVFCKDYRRQENHETVKFDNPSLR